MTDESTNEQQSDGVIVDMNTGERSDEQQAPFEIVEHEDGKRYIAADKVEEYRQHKAAELAAMQTEIDDTLNAIAKIDKINAIEKRQAEMQSLIKRFGEDEYSGLMDVTDFTNEDEVIAVIQFMEYSYQGSFNNPSAGFGKSKQPQADTQKTLYEYGQKMARQAYEKRRR